MYGGTITSVSAPTTVGSTSCAGQTSGSYCYSTGTGFAGDESAAIQISFTASVANPVLAWGGHIATRKDWGLGNSAIAISGSPYHTRLIDLNGSGGNQDRSLSAQAVVFPGFIHIVKNASGGDNTFGFTASPSPLANCSITTSGGTGGGPDASHCFFDMITNFTTYTVTENTPLPTDWVFQNLQCTVAPGTANGGTQTVNGQTVTIALAEGEEVTCTYSNAFVARRTLSITKSTTTASFDHVGQVIPYTIVATNTGNVAQTITVSDTPGLDGFACTPSNGSTVQPGGTMSCSGTHTVMAADLAAGHFPDTACANAPGATQACASKDVPAAKLTITKVATESSYSAVGDVVHYTITATNAARQR
jgi:uncharacterized repeat protein (TIGR01451 family)